MNTELLGTTVGLLALHGYLWWARAIKFYELPKCTKVGGSSILSPVCGRVVYSFVEHSAKTSMVKNSRVIEGPVLNPEEDYYHIGIFMNPLNNHHLLYPSQQMMVVHQYNEKDQLLDMWNWKDSLGIFRWWKNWWNKKYPGGFIELNKRTIFVFDNGIILVMIYDKYVNKFTPWDKTNKYQTMRDIIGFVHRGSQCDIYLPTSKFNKPVVSVGDKVNFDTLITESR